MNSPTPDKLRKTTPPMIVIRSLWGNDDADSTIKISPQQWKKIQKEDEFEKQGWGYYEGQRFSVCWYFNNGKVTISGCDRECLINDPIENLFIS